MLVNQCGSPYNTGGKVPNTRDAFWVISHLPILLILFDL